MRTYLCLDLATQTGWSVVKNGEIVASGTQSFAKKRGESNGIMFLRFHRWLNELVDLCDTLDVIVCYEQAHFRGGAATEICVGLQTHLQSWCAQKRMECAPVTTQDLKKFATGNGAADKTAMKAAAEKVLGRPPLDDNEADAVLIGKWAVAQFGAYDL